MPDNHYENPRLTLIYDLDSGWSAEREFYLSLAGSSSIKVLDIGCGTGLLCNAYAANNHQVTGVDPSSAMLDLGRQKPHGKKVEWIQSFAQDLNLSASFDLIIMTGHAFQVLIDDDDVLATFATMRKHLKPNGLIVFESRNPAIDWSNNWNYDMKLTLPTGGTVEESRRFISMDENKMSFDLRYQFQDELLTSASLLRFWTKREIEIYAASAGLSVNRIMGGWDGAAFDENTSEEMIFFLHKES